MKAALNRFFVLSASLLLLCAAVLPAIAAEDMMQDEYRILRDDEVLKFQQGYEITLKGFGADAVLVEFYNNYSDHLPMGYEVLREGETVRCSRVSDEGNATVLVLTLDKLYLNNSRAIAGFSHIFQYEDVDTRYTEDTVWIFEKDVLVDPADPHGPDDPGNGSGLGQDLISEPLYIILLIGLAAAALILIILIFGKKARKMNQKDKKQIKNGNNTK